MKRILVMSDIHGELEMFERLLAKVNYDPELDQLILLGDYVDRGLSSRKVLDKVMRLHADGALVLKGNHEDMMIKALTEDNERAWKHWTERNGGDKTLQSYGFSEEDLFVLDDENFSKPKLQSKTLKNHLAFIQSLDHVIEWEEIIFVHAGVNPQQTIAETDPYQFMWIREAFYKAYAGKKTVIFGHTTTKNLHNNPDNHAPYFGQNNIIGIDGGAVYGGQLNCLELPTRNVYTIAADK